VGTRATSTSCPNCGRWIELKLPYLCKVCGYSMIHKRCINYPKNIVRPLFEMDDSATVEPRASSLVGLFLVMRRLGLVDWEGSLTREGRAAVETATRGYCCL
jgi:hypothetical protein